VTFLPEKRHILYPESNLSAGHVKNRNPLAGVPVIAILLELKFLRFLHIPKGSIFQRMQYYDRIFIVLLVAVFSKCTL